MYLARICQYFKKGLKTWKGDFFGLDSTFNVWMKISKIQPYFVERDLNNGDLPP